MNLRTNIGRTLGPICLLSLLAAIPNLHAAVVYDYANDFSPTNNPNGVWSYGFSTTLGGALTLYTATSTSDSVTYWVYNPSNMGDGANQTAVTRNPCCAIFVAPGQGALAPGQFGEFAVARFTAPTTADYSISAYFQGADATGNGSVDTHVVHNGTAVFNAEVTGYGAPSQAAYSNTLHLAAGDTVDFVVGWGTDLNYSYDNTAFDASLTQVAASAPEPSTLALFGLGAMVVVMRRRKSAAR